jgi:hypothetical protein
MGIMSTMQVLHEQNTGQGGAGRTDTTAEKVKWAAVIEQERHYKKHLGVDLKWYRTHMDLANSSWNGAVKGYLTTPQGVVEKVARYGAKKDTNKSSSEGDGRRRQRKFKRDHNVAAIGAEFVQV